MSAEQPDLKSTLATVAARLGVRVVRVDRLRADRVTMVTIAVPLITEISIDEDAYEDAYAANRILVMLQEGARRLFADTVEYIAKYDRSPIDRVRDLEASARKLIIAVESTLNGRTTAHDLSLATFELHTILGHQPGSAAWVRNGFGGDQTDLVVAADALEQAGHLELAERLRAGTR
jgi:hypothetical protein